MRGKTRGEGRRGSWMGDRERGKGETYTVKGEKRMIVSRYIPLMLPEFQGPSSHLTL